MRFFKSLFTFGAFGAILVFGYVLFGQISDGNYGKAFMFFVFGGSFLSLFCALVSNGNRNNCSVVEDESFNNNSSDTFNWMIPGTPEYYVYHENDNSALASDYENHSQAL